jgi:hypothetical protein
VGGKDDDGIDLNKSDDNFNCEDKPRNYFISLSIEE